MSDEVELSEITDENLVWANKVSGYIKRLAEEYPSRITNLSTIAPYGSLEYGMALEHWNKIGRPDDSWFSYDEGQKECPWLMEFRKELTKEFGLPVYNKDETKLRDKIAQQRLTDNGWHIN